MWISPAKLTAFRITTRKHINSILCRRRTIQANCRLQLTKSLNLIGLLITNRSGIWCAYWMQQAFVYQRLSTDSQNEVKKVKVVHTRLPSVGFRSWSRFLAVSLQVAWVVNPAVGCHYFPPGLQLPRNPQEGCYQFRCLVNTGTMGVNSLPKTVTRQRRGCDLNPGPSAPESSTLTTRLPMKQHYVVNQ